MKKTASLLTLSAAIFSVALQSNAQPVADFTYAFTNGGCTPDSVVFTNTSTGANEYLWDFGDFSPPVYAVDTSHWYFGIGTYIVTLTAYDTLTGDSSQTIQIINIEFTPFPGWAWFSTDPPNPVCYGTSIDFNSFILPTPTSMVWDFDDGDSSTSFSPTHTYTDTGTYTVILIVSNSCGSDTFISPVIIDTTSLPNIFFISASPTTVCPDYPVNFELCSNCDDPSNSYLWDFDDGDFSTVANPSHAFTLPGIYNVQLITTNNCSSDTDLVAITVDSTLIPSVSASAFPSTVCPGDMVTFNGSGSQLTDYFWDFDDGDISLQEDPEHAFADTGTYDVAFTVTNACGNSNSDTVTVVVDTNTAPSPGFTWNPSNVCPNTEVYFNNNSTNYVSSFWDFDDSTTSTDDNPLHLFSDTGSYNVKLIVTSSCGGIDSVTNTVNVVDDATITANFCFDPPFCFFPSPFCPGSPVFFENWSSDTTNSFWDFGDSATSTEPNPIHIYTDTGTFTIVLTVTNECGNSDMHAQTITITYNAAPPGHFINASPSFVCPGEAVNFEILEMPFFFLVDTADVLWDFGDGNTSTTTNPSYAYDTSGNFTVTLVVYTACGNDTTTRDVTVKSGSAPDFTYTIACLGDITFFSDASSPLPDTWAWDFGDGDTSTTQNPQHLFATGGFQNVSLTVVKDGCVSSITKPVYVDDLSIDSTIVTNVSCNGACDGTATVFPSGGSAPYTYLWSNAQTTQTATGLCPGTYDVTVTDVLGCMASDTVTITEPPLLTAVITDIINVSCFGFCDGSATVTPAGGTPPYNYLWLPGGGTDSTYIGMCAGGPYTVTVTDANGCTAIDSVTITEPPLLTATITSSTNVSCNGLCDGDAAVTPGGGTSPYTYLWSNGDNTPTADTLCAGVSYTVTVTDTNGCTIADSVTITEPLLLTATITASTNVSCSGGNDGEATVLASGGSAPYTYSWSPSGGTDSTATGLSAGCYTVTVTDTNGCDTTVIVCITEPPVLTADITDSTNASCFGLCDGTACVSPVGGTPPYAYIWCTTPPETDSCAVFLCPGTTCVYVTDANGCIDSSSVTLTEPPILTSGISGSNNTSCFGACDGDATATAGGGIPPYAYSWNDPLTQTTAFADSLCAGAFDVVVTDANGCTDISSIAITEPSAITLTLSSVDATCDSADGEASVIASDGVAPYTYLWNDTLAQTTDTATGLAAGAYTVLVTDANGCTAIGIVSVNNAGAATVSISSITNVNCNGDSTGAATVTASGGITPYTYSWSPYGGTDSTATGLSAGPYTVTVTDSNGCIATGIVTISEPAVFVISVSFSNVSCNGLCDGDFTVTASGGIAPYTYSWVPWVWPPQDLCPGTFDITVIDSNGCADSASVTITEPAVLTSSITSLTNTSCLICDGTATVTPAGGTAPYAYSWDDPLAQTDSAATGLCPGIYNVGVTDANGCTTSSGDTITGPGGLSSGITSSTDVSCNGGCDGDATVTVTGSTAPYTYLWDDSLSQTTATADSLCASTYSVTVTDSNGCITTSSVTITEPPVLISSISGSTNASCNGVCDGSATVSVTDGTPPYSLLWSNGCTPPCTSFCAGTYTITVTDNLGCVDSSNVTITEPSPITASPLTSTPDTNNTGVGTATISSVSGSSPPYTYNWLPSGGTGSTAAGLTAGFYTVDVTDTNGCQYTDTVSVSNINVISIFEINPDMKFDIYPNPNKGQFMVEITNTKNDDYLIEVKNIIGQLVYTEQIYPPVGGGKFTTEIDLSERGAYFISISNSSGTTTKKLIVY